MDKPDFIKIDLSIKLEWLNPPKDTAAAAIRDRKQSIINNEIARLSAILEDGIRLVIS
jgi:hypothetical protein